MLLKRFIPRLAAPILLAALASCSKDPTSAGLGHVSVHLTDAPGDFEHVNLVVTGVSIHRGDEEDSGGWETLTLDSTTVYDLLELRNGVFARLAQGDVPAGHYTQIRLHLGAGSNVVIDGITYPLTVPSGMQSGYKLVGEFDVPEGGGVELTLDFDAARSVHLTGSNKYMLRPTVRVIVNHVARPNIMGFLPRSPRRSMPFRPDTVDDVAGADGRRPGRLRPAAMRWRSTPQAKLPGHDDRRSTPGPNTTRIELTPVANGTASVVQNR